MNRTTFFLLGAIVVGVGVLAAVYLGAIPGVPPLSRQAAVTSAPSQGTGTPTAPAASGTASSPAQPPVTVEAGGKQVIVPSFDVLRVEPSGSLVVAGTAAPGSKVDIIAGSTPLGSAKAEANGDFAIVLDKALQPGDHQLVLRATSPDGTSATSLETAVVSIPEKPDGQVLALVEKPGEPSRLITKPKATETAEAGPKDASPAARQDNTSTSAAPTEASGGTPAATAPGKSSTGAPGTGSAPENVAKADGQQTPPAPGDGMAKPFVTVEAVEIENSKIYVAGQATPGKRVLVYANDSLIGSSKVSPAGRFLVDEVHDLAVGDYIIRADLVDPNGMAVIARAAVPFTREKGERVAAVAPSANSEAAPSSSSGQGSSAAGTPPMPAGSATLSETPPSVAGAGGTKLGAPLQEAEGSVIIRRGDTLWTIADRVYGKGVRYTTIYLANKGQIQDPDKIWPGQVFAMPQKSISDEEALKVHRETH